MSLQAWTLRFFVFPAYSIRGEATPPNRWQPSKLAPLCGNIVVHTEKQAVTHELAALWDK